MLTRWSSHFAAVVSKRIDAILREPQSHPRSEVDAARRTQGLLVYGDPGGVIALTTSGEFVLYDPESETVQPVEEGLWTDVALAYMGKHYPELRELLPDRPADAADCPNCSGSGWMMDGRLFCGRCRGLGWVEEVWG